MTDYGEVTREIIVGTFDGYFRIITEDAAEELHDFHIPFSVAHDPDSFLVDFDFEAVEYEGPDGRQVISCPERFRKLANENQHDILKKANV